MLLPGLAVLLADGYDLGRLSLWRDEAYTVDAAHRTLPQIFALLGHTDAVNGAYYLVMHGDIALFGTSAAALRLPSLLAMAVAAAVTSAIGRRLAQAMALPAPSVTGLLAGLLFAAAPTVTRYAQEARSYGIVTMCATVASYLLIRALADGRWRWWVPYGVAIALTAAFNLLALLLVAAHLVTVMIAGWRRPAAPSVAPPPARRWLAAVAGALIVLIPLAVLGYRQRGQIGWLVTPRLHDAIGLIAAFSGTRALIPLAVLAALAGVLAALTGRRTQVDTATLALPWLVLPPAILLIAAQVHPVYNSRYVTFCLPALALLEAAGLAWLASLIGHIPLRWVGGPVAAKPEVQGPEVQGPVDRGAVVQGMAAEPQAAAGSAAPDSVAGNAVARGAVAGEAAIRDFVAGRAVRGAVAWVPAVIVVAIMAALLAAPQRGVRAPSSRPDNLRAAAAIIAARERPGDAVVYLPASRRVFGMGYPAPFQRLRDLSLARTPVAAHNLLGTNVGPPVLRRRFTGVSRVWLVTQRSRNLFPARQSPLERAEIALLSGLRLAGRWHAGDVQLNLFVRT